MQLARTTMIVNVKTKNQSTRVRVAIYYIQYSIFIVSGSPYGKLLVLYYTGRMLASRGVWWWEFERIFGENN